MRTPRTPSSMVLIAMALILGTCSPPSPGVNVPDAKPDHVGQDVGVDLADAATDLPVPDQGPETDLPPADQKEADACVPSCVGLECGDDGCGGSCGSCWASEQCFFGSCASDGEPGAPCGEDGDCADGGPCLDWQGDLVCAPPCDPADPEPCPGDWECITAKGYEHSFCIPPCEPATCDELGAECGEPEDGCFGVADCGGCGDDAVCTEDFLCACLYETCGEVCCAEGVPCVDGACQSGPPPCDPPCPAEAWCDDGTCVPKKGPGESCGFDVECLAGLACTGGLCCAGSDVTCDGVDDDCSGAADEDWVSDSSCGQGYCKANNSPSTCEGGVEVPCEPGEALTPDDATCDSVDDDCDGEADDDYVTDDSCGVGLCKTANIPGACLNGVEFDCLPGQPLGPKDLLCNGVDDDCDGQTDEDYLPSSKCGFGWCQTAAIPSACMNGFEIPCQPGLPLASDDVTCNGVDEDCSGAADEDFIPDTDCGVGWCQESATPSSCVQGIEAPCEPGVPLGDLDSACDGVDEDCDGLLDEDFVPDVSCGLGYCAAAASPSSCEAGVLDPCTPGAPLVLVDDDCDKVDGDCDGEVDEDAATVCIYGGPVTGAEVTFATTIGGASGVSGEDPEGVYGTLILDLTRSGDEGYVTASAYEADSSPGGLAVDAPVPELLDLAASRGAVFKDDPMVRLCAFVADGLGSPMELPVTIFVQAPQFSQAWLASSVGDGLLCTWVTVPPAVFTAGATLSFVATTGVQESPPVEVEAVAAPAALVLPPGRVGLQVPFGPRLPGTTFDVPVRVNTAGAEVGSYKLQVGFDPVMLQVTGLSAGSSGAMGPPVSNAGTTANTTGSLSFNGINVAPGTGKGIGPALELAVIHFKVRPQAAGGTISTVDGVASEVFSTVFVNLVSDPVMLVLGPTGTGSSALVAVDGNTTEAIWTFVPDPVMLDEALITGVHPTTPLVVPALRRDGSVAQVQGAAGMSCGSSQATIAKVTSCVVTAAGRGQTNLTVAYQGLGASTSVRVLTPNTPLSVTLDDPKLSYIVDIDRMQDTRAHVRATFSDGVAYSWVRDVTAQVGFGSSKPTVAEVGDGGEVISMGTGTADIRAYAAGGSLLGSATVSVLPQNYVTVEDLHVLVPAFLAMSSLPSGAVDPAGGEAEVAASLTNQLQFEGQQVQARAVLILSDEEETASGSRLDVTGDPDLAWQTTDPLVGEMSPTGVITARGTGSAEAQATFSGAWGDVFTSTDGDFEVQLPPPTKVTLSIPNSKIARSTTDTAYTILGLPISRVITVTVHFADGTTRNMTSDLRTHLAVTGSLVTVKDKSTCGTTPNCVPGTVTSTGTGTGQVLVQVSFTGAYLSALTGIISVQVVGHQGLALTVSELYTPQGEESVPETTLSYIEGTSTRQRGRAKVVASFTDGSTSDVTSNTGVSYQVTSNLTGQPAPGALVVSSQAIVSGTQVGLWDLTAKLAGNSSPPVTLSVSNTTADLDLLSVTYPPGSTLLGVKGQEAGSLRVIGTFADGTRNLLTQEGLINGLLVFQSATPSRAAVSATGALTPLSNGPVTFTVDVAADASVSFNPPATRYLPVNLTPAAGDVDLGDATGLPFPDRDADEIFSLPVRVNTGTLALGGLDLRITYDPLVLEALDAKVGTPLTGGIFSANVSIPGTVFLNVTPPLSGFAAGPAVEVAVLTFRALKTPGGPSISTMGGSVIGFLDTGGATIGGGVPRFFIAGAGPLDPAPGGVWGDADDSGAFTVGDVLFIQKTIVEPPLVTPTPTQLEQSDLFPDGGVTSNDAFFASQSLARLVHFVDLDISTQTPGVFILAATLTDRDQQPVTSGVRVWFEVQAGANLATMQFTNPRVATASGVKTLAVHQGGGIWTTSVSGLVAEVPMGVVVLLEVLDGGGDAVTTTAWLGSPELDSDSPFVPLAFFGESWCIPSCAGKACGAADGCPGGGLCNGPCPGQNQVCEDGQCGCVSVSCGGACCPAENTCKGTQCCDPQTCAEAGATCGLLEDGCGNLQYCGTCGDNEVCLAGECGCVDEVCQGLCCPMFYECQGGVCTAPECIPDCLGKACGLPDGCGGLCQGPCFGQHTTCVQGVCECTGPACGTGCCAPGQTCQGGACVGVCQPFCDGLLCGDPDGCGGGCADAPCLKEDSFCLFGSCECLYTPCGEGCCGIGETCKDGVCTACSPNCLNKACGAWDGCGGFCNGPCAGENQICANGVCACQHKKCGQVCCDSGETCFGGQCCAPTTCTALSATCGYPSDGCGATLLCGSCPANFVCGTDYKCKCQTMMCNGVCCPKGQACQGGACVPCTPSCINKPCGADNGCGGLCNGLCTDPNASCMEGSCECLFEECQGACCNPGESCVNGQCFLPCQPNCFAKDCGAADGCGGKCQGPCNLAWQTCEAGSCVCAFDACGAGCCPPGQDCYQGTCCTPQSCEGLGVQCGTVSNGCGGQVTCNLCGPNATCGPGNQCSCTHSSCGGKCCGAGEICYQGACCPLNTCSGIGAECGSPTNGCGGTLSCGSCGPAETCTADSLCLCAFDTCEGACCAEDEICFLGECVSNCASECEGKICGQDDGCGNPCTGPCPDPDKTCVMGQCTCNGITCGADCCPFGQGCVGGVCAPCTANCTGKVCGAADGCGGKCLGTCPSMMQYCAAGTCTCVFSPCGTDCCDPGETCYQGMCCTPKTCLDFPAVECGMVQDGCGGILNCGGCGADGACGVNNVCACSYTKCGDNCCGQGQTCNAGSCCTPWCQGVPCGSPDGCGGTCKTGTCADLDETCQNGQCVCKYQSCNGQCCASGETCSAGACVPCSAACAGKPCGAADGCGGKCNGSCPLNFQTCIQGVCTCDDQACGGICCAPGLICAGGSCCTPATCQSLGAKCGTPSNGCGGTLSCGACLGDRTCTAQNQCACTFQACGNDCCAQGQVCSGGQCCTPLTCSGLGAECGIRSNGCGGMIACGACGEDEFCTADLFCECLFVACNGVCCGDGEACIGGQCKSTCVPQCTGKPCGAADGCGGTCFAPCGDPDQVCTPQGCTCLTPPCFGDCCSSGQVCLNGACAYCQENCEGKACGAADGCGGVCFGTCADPMDVCFLGTCVCAGLECGAACCSPGQVCNGGQCCTPSTSCAAAGAECGAPPDFCGGTMNCGVCPANSTCTGSFQCQCTYATCGDACCDQGRPCVGGVCCVPDCANAFCGDDDGCGGLCDGPCTEVLYTECAAGSCECIGDACGGVCCGPGKICSGVQCVSCTPSCTGASCGQSDGCGGLCQGTCSDPLKSCVAGVCQCAGEACGSGCCGFGDVCHQGSCCSPATCGELGVECGPVSDGCGGVLQCGACGPGEECSADHLCECTGVTCGGDQCCLPGSVCNQGACCLPWTCEALGADCGTASDGCGTQLSCGTCGANEVCSPLDVCVCAHKACNGVCCAQGQNCVGGQCTGSCIPACAGKACGAADGCGGVCSGSCPGQNQVCVSGACVCSGPACGGACCASGQTCVAGVCKTCVPDCTGKACGVSDGCGGICLGPCPGAFEVCDNGICVCQNSSCLGECCGPMDACIGGACCTPATCLDLEATCGTPSDGCGQFLSCGACGAGAICNAENHCACLYQACGSACCAQGDKCFGGICCTPSCQGKACGAPDGCGGTCGSGTCPLAFQQCVGGVCVCPNTVCNGVCCGPGEPCVAGACVPCVANCVGKTCGQSDGCGGKCSGACAAPNTTCHSGACVCAYASCGGTCCAPGLVCNGNTCCDPSTCGELGAECGFPSNGCGSALSCGACPADQVCSAGFTCDCEFTACGNDCCAEGAICKNGACCTPASCDSLGRECGTPPNGCGGTATCGACSPLETCGADFLCHCAFTDCQGQCCEESETCTGGACTPCQPQCAAASCGDPDGCGGVCDGPCPNPAGVCVDGTCECLFLACGAACCAQGEGCVGGACVPCTPNCTGKACGAADGCGGTCNTGTCSGNATCVAGACLCNYLSCGGTCCGQGQICDEGACCTPQTCAALGATCGNPVEACGVTLSCGSCGPFQTCGPQFSCGCANVQCGSACCAPGAVCNAGACCTPNCANKACGAPDGCGGTCGSGFCTGINQHCVNNQCTCKGVACGGGCCKEYETCQAGQCVACVPNCTGKACGAADGCGGTCYGPCPLNQSCSQGQCLCLYESCGGLCCGPGQTCDDGECCDPESCLTLGAECGAPSNGCGGTLTCGSCVTYETCGPSFTCDCLFVTCGSACCPPDTLCYQNACCAPASCQGQGIECGSASNGCGGTLSCGTCTGGKTCVAGVCTAGCTPSCAGKACGAADGCGGLCQGSCPLQNQVCTLGVCACQGPACGGGCCAAGQTCVAGACVTQCVPDCIGKACGAADGCGGTCILGTCPAGKTCVMGVCL